MTKISGQRLFDNGKNFLIEMDLPEAAKAFQTAQKKVSRPPVVYSYLLYTYLLQSDYKSLKKEFNKKKEFTGFGNYSLYWYLFMIGDTHSITPLLHTMIHSDNYFARIFALKELWKRGEISNLDEMLKKHINYFNLSYEMPVEELRSAVYIDIMNNRHHLALLQLKNSLKSSPEFTDLYLDILETLCFINDGNKSREILEIPVFTEIAKKDFRIMYYMSKVSYQAGDFEKANYYLNILTQVFQNNPIFFFNLGNVQLSLNRPKKALAYYRETLAIDPNFGEAHYNLGTLYMKFGQFADAQKHLEKAVAIKNDPRSIYNLSIALIETRKLEEAYYHLSDLRKSNNEFRHEALEMRNHIRNMLISA